MIIEMGDDTFAKNLIYLRKKHRMSRKALASSIGISQYVLKAIENGVTYPALPLDSFDRICQVFQISPDDLVHTDLGQ